ncbi:MAG: hypothetical protein ACI8U3_001261 [Brevundimonas sp.]|jgi:hypothetical protein|uniref:radical SAM protein n=1 Tax=Brevundimonas sp. TaxID=1871086 RepID=UPI0039E67BF9
MYVPRTLTILTTDRCTAECDHCSVFSDKKRTDRLTAAQMIDSIGQASELGGLQTVVFAGGEPTLLKEDLLEAIAYAYSLGINTRLITNASWAVSDQKARKKLLDLRQAGLVEINFSLDKYHSPYIPVGHVLNAWRAAKGIGFRSVVLATHHSNENPYTEDVVFEMIGEQIPVINIGDPDSIVEELRADDGTFYCLSYGPLQKLGRAAQKIPDEVFGWYHLDQLEMGCQYYAVSPALSPRNSLLSCCGVEANRNPLLDFGVVEEDGSVEKMLRERSEDLFSSAFSVIGPVGMARVLRDNDENSGIHERYTSVCQVCEHITTDPVIRDKLSRLTPQIAQACVKRHLLRRAS